MQETRVTYGGCAEQGAPAEVALRLPPAVPHGGAAAGTGSAPSAASLQEQWLKRGEKTKKVKKEKEERKQERGNGGRQTKGMRDFNRMRKEEDRNGEDGELAAKGTLGSTCLGSPRSLLQGVW